MHREHYYWDQPHAVAVSDLIGLAVDHPDEPGSIEQACVDLTPAGCHVETIVAWADLTCELCANHIDARVVYTFGEDCRMVLEGSRLPLTDSRGFDAHVAMRWMVRRADKGVAAGSCPLFRGERG